MKIYRQTLACTIAILLSSTATADCSNNRAVEKAKLAKVDAQLNATWKQVKVKLPTDEFQALLMRQRSWPNYRDIMAASSALGRPAEAKEALDQAEFYCYQADITETRERFLRALIVDTSTPNKAAAWSGEFNDSFGGTLLTSLQADGLHFSLSVVRGETYHTGGIGGVAKIVGSQAVFQTETENYETEQEGDTETAIVRIKKVGNLMRVETENAQNFAGARAYFDSDYARFEAAKATDLNAIKRNLSEDGGR